MTSMSAILPPRSAEAAKPVGIGRWWTQALQNKLAQWIVPVILILAWQIAAQAGWLSSRILPEPWAVAKAFWVLAASGELWTHVHVSLWRAIASFVVGGGLGLLLGLLTGTFKTAETLLDTSLQMIRNIPALALIPLVILWFGIEESAKLFLVSIGVFFPVYLNTFHGMTEGPRPFPGRGPFAYPAPEP
ncbi:MAG: hypothetical protein ACXU7H_03770, partial [Burkholderiaceae bacterium]